MNTRFEPFAQRYPSHFSGRSIQLHTFLEQRQLPLLQSADERRARIDSLEQLEKHATFMRKTFVEKMGGLPNRDCPLNPQTTKILDMGDYTVEGVVFNAR